MENNSSIIRYVEMDSPEAFIKQMSHGEKFFTISNDSIDFEGIYKFNAFIYSMTGIKIESYMYILSEKREGAPLVVRENLLDLFTGKRVFKDTM